MMHIREARLEDGVEWTEEEAAHVATCVRCRLAARWLREPVETVEFDVQRTLDGLRASVSMQLTMGTLGADVSWEGNGPSSELPTIELDVDGGELLGRGGMGEVLRVRDPVLRRSVAVKLASAPLQANQAGLRRFLAEARVGARLQHPGIVPVHQLGRLADGRVFFSMKEVEGQTLTDVLRPLQTAEQRRSARRRVLDGLRRVSEAVAFAHAQGVFHRDLKPDNIMFGSFGEVWVLDWGLAKLELDVAERDTWDDVMATRVGTVHGTPSYMAPEQAEGRVTDVGPWTDVYALGAVLYEILTGQPPYQGASPQAVVMAVRAGPPEPPSARVSDALPEELEALCLQAMAREPRARAGSASDFAASLTAWLDGTWRAQRAAEAVTRAQARLPDVARARAEAAELSARAAEYLAALPSHAPEDDKRAGWALEDRAAALRSRATVEQARYLEGLHRALEHDPSCQAAHIGLADHYRALHEVAEAEGRPTAALEEQLRHHDQGRHEAYLSGEGRLKIEASEGSSLRVSRYVLSNRRLVAEDLGLAASVMDELTLPHGSYVLDVDRVQVPVVIPRAGEVSVRAAAKSGDDCVVSAGWFRAGGDAGDASSWPATSVWVDAFAMQRHPVTIGDYLVFLNDLLARDREAALRHALRERPTRQGEAGALLIDVDTEVSLRVDAQGDSWNPRWPVWMVSWEDAMAYAAWRAERDGLPWRLPWEIEWEKAARGVDGRLYPWGNFADPTWAAVAGGRAGRLMPQEVGAHPVDRSPYGVEDLTGGVCEWTLDLASADGPAVDPTGRWQRPASCEAAESTRERIVRGGSWGRPIGEGRSARRVPWTASDRRWAIGFRLVRSL